MNGPTPDKVMQLITGAWAASILVAAAQHGLFTALEEHPDSTDGVARKTGISSRGAQALLDGLTGLGLLTLSNGKYQNTPAHQEAPADNVTVFRKFRKALKPGGALIVNDFILNDDRTGHPFAMLFASQMLVVTEDGSTYRQSDYRSWLTEAGFTSIEVVPTPTPATVFVAR
jgi:hypothetical protein